MPRRIVSEAAIAAGADGLFLEVHPEPDKALSDGPNSIRLDELEPLLKQFKAINNALIRPEKNPSHA